MYYLQIANSGSVSSAEIRASLDMNDPEQAQVAATIDHIEKRGTSYSGQEFDVLSLGRSLARRSMKTMRLVIWQNDTSDPQSMRQILNLVELDMEPNCFKQDGRRLNARGRGRISGFTRDRGPNTTFELGVAP